MSKKRKKMSESESSQSKKIKIELTPLNTGAYLRNVTDISCLESVSED